MLSSCWMKVMYKQRIAKKEPPIYKKIHTFDPSIGWSLQVNQSETYSCQLSSCNCVSGQQDIFVIWTKSVVSPSPSSTTIVLVQLLLLILVGHKVEIQL